MNVWSIMACCLQFDILICKIVLFRNFFSGEGRSYKPLPKPIAPGLFMVRARSWILSGTFYHFSYSVANLERDWAFMEHWGAVYSIKWLRPWAGMAQTQTPVRSATLTNYLWWLQSPFALTRRSTCTTCTCWERKCRFTLGLELCNEDFLRSRARQDSSLYELAILADWALSAFFVQTSSPAKNGQAACHSLLPWLLVLNRGVEVRRSRLALCPPRLPENDLYSCRTACPRLHGRVQLQISMPKPTL